MSDETIEVKREDGKEPFSEKMRMENIHFHEKGKKKISYVDIFTKYFNIYSFLRINLLYLSMALHLKCVVRNI